MIPSSRVPQPGDPSKAFVSVEIRRGVGVVPVLIAFFSSASLTLILLLLLRLGAFACLPGRSLTVSFGDGDRERCPGALTITTDWSSSVSDMLGRRPCSLLIAGRGFSSPDVDGVEKTSAASARAGPVFLTVSLGNGGTGGGKASNSGELE